MRAKQHTHKGFTGTVPEWAERLGVPAVTLYRRLQRGYESAHVFTATPHPHRRIVRVGRKVRTLQEWADANGLFPSTIANRLKAGEDPASAVTRPPHNGLVVRPDDGRKNRAERAERARLDAVLARVEATNKRARERVRAEREAAEARARAMNEEARRPRSWRERRDAAIEAHRRGRVETSEHGRGPAGGVARESTPKQDFPA